ncbi:hypothetical protein [Listeria booriae]|uniref:hypothetical protein n=1 Tax=Listeria booriae TaxID=1552123 RepID=UPI0016245C4D|nr:hypothetical protein [Listeria booriae]MBC1272652.1 hypothetical protein [Listeria booriae]
MSILDKHEVLQQLHGKWEQEKENYFKRVRDLSPNPDISVMSWTTAIPLPERLGTKAWELKNILNLLSPSPTPIDEILEIINSGGKTMTKLKIDEQLYSEITSGLAVANGTDLNKLFHITSEISNESLAANQLTIHDIPALVVGNFEVVRKFDIGSYYSLDGVISKITGYDDNRYLIRAEACADGAVVCGDFVTGTQMYCEAKPASEAEILQFDRVYHFHKQGRKLNEFREGDIVFNPARGTYPVFEVMDPYVSPNNIKLVCPVEKRGDR